MLSSFLLAAVAFISIPLSRGMPALCTDMDRSMLVVVDTELSAGLVGLALTYTISLSGMFQFCVRQSAEVENIVC